MKEGYDNYKTKTKLALPFKGTWIVGNGGRSALTNNHRRDDNSGPEEQTFAYDFKGKHKTDGKNLKDYEVYSKEIVAPAAGTICQVIDGSIDIQIGERDRGIGYGNVIIIDHHNGEWSVLAHIKQNSIRVNVGDKVNQGEVLALCGNTGNTSEPHIHYQLQNNALKHIAHGLPALFERILVDGEIVENAEPIRGQQVSNID